MVYTSVIPVLRRPRQEDHKFEASLGNRMRPLRGGKVWRCSSAVEYLCSIFKALDPIHSTGIKRRR
jgi:hypothetical protein